MKRRSLSFISISDGLDYFEAKIKNKDVGDIQKKIAESIDNQKNTPKKKPRQSHICCIYKITCIENGKFYIGSTRQFLKRMCTHKSELKRGIHRSRQLQLDYDKYGKGSFVFEILTILNQSISAPDLLQHEESIIASSNPDMLYNKLAKVILFTDLDKVDDLMEELKRLQEVKSFRIWHNI